MDENFKDLVSEYQVFSSYLIFRIYVLLSIKVEDLFPLLSSPILSYQAYRCSLF
jgi:hypothetical protein